MTSPKPRVPRSERRPFPRKARLSKAAEFDAVRAGKARKSHLGLSAMALPNDLKYYRLGLSIGRAVGGAVERNRVKRLLREAFRLLEPELPRRADNTCYDILLATSKGDGWTLENCRATVCKLATECHAVWEKRRQTRE